MNEKLHEQKAQSREKEDEKGLQAVRDITTMIKDEDIDNVIRLSDDTCTWARLVQGGFQLKNMDRIVEEFRGRIVSIKTYAINFSDEPASKLFDIESYQEIPPGYTLRTDIKIEIEGIGGNVIGLSLPLSSAKYQLSPYLRHLKSQGLKPDEVVTRITSRQATNPKGTFAVAVFEAVERIKSPSGSPPEQEKPTLPPEWS